MDWTILNDPNQLLYALLFVAAVTLLPAMLLLLWVLWRVRRIKLPPDADFITALRATPFVVVVLLDLLDLSLDFLSAPIAWVILGRLGLKPLRGVTVVEGLLPGTQFLPTMTLAWFIARLAGSRRVF